MGRKRQKVGTQQSHYEKHNTLPRDTDEKDADKHSLTDGQVTESQSDRNETKLEKSIEKHETTTKDIFPNWLPWILFPLTLIIRILYVLEPTNWWVLHPDEIFQTIEVAHSDRFGYGFRPYEYLPPPGNDVINSSIVSSAYKQQIKLEMYSLRSFILPKMLSVVMLLADMCGIDASPYLVIKICHVVLTSLLPVIVFKFSRKFYSSRDIGCLSAVLVSSSLCLNVFGTHTLINSFVSPFLFLSLVPLLDLLKSVEIPDKLEQEETSSFLTSASLNSETDLETEEPEDAKGSKVIGANGNIATEHIHDLKESPVEQSNSKFSSHDENANIIYLKGKFSYLNVLNYCGLKYDIASSRAPVRNNAKIQLEIPKCGRILGLLNINEASAAFGLALCIYIRTDLISIPVLLILCRLHHVLSNVCKFLRSIRSYLVGFVTGILIGGYCDYVTYGKWFLAPYQWYKFNVWNNSAGRIFGVNSCSFYVLKLYENEPLVTLSLTMVLIDMLISVILRLVGRNFTVHSHTAKNQSLAIFVLLLSAFSLNSHKELRFMHDAIIFMYIAVACAILSIYKKSKILFYNQNHCQYSIYCVYIFIVLFTSSHCYHFQNIRLGDRAKWTYSRNTESHETNACLDFIRQQEHVSGVFMDRSVHMSGVYSILHRDVPIFALNMFEYMEYRQQANSNIPEGQDSKSIEKKGFTTFTEIADFISIRNWQFLLKTLITKPEYNFLVFGTNHEFIKIGYEEVFRTGNSKVLKRIQEERSEMDLRNVADKIQIRWNATVLEYEGDWLKHFGMYVKAEKRLLMANRVDSKRIGIFRILMDMYTKLGVRDSYTSVLNACLQLYKKSQCLEPYVPIKLHRGYYRKT